MAISYICPVSGLPLSLDNSNYYTTPDNRFSYPCISGIPILLSDSQSLFCQSDIINNYLNRASGFNSSMQAVKSALPSISKNFVAHKLFSDIGFLLQKKLNPKVLIIGGGTKGAGISNLLKINSILVVSGDIFISEDTTVVFDAHNLPFADSVFDCVIIQAVLEHVVDPVRCVSEAYRVLNTDGIIYSETPFMQQVHMGKYDFTRFTFLGHRRLFRSFEQIRAGMVAGPATSLAWAIRYFLLSFFDNSAYHKCINVLCRFALFPLKWFDYYLMSKKSSFMGASGFYFLGSKAVAPIGDLEVQDFYIGT